MVGWVVSDRGRGEVCMYACVCVHVCVCMYVWRDRKITSKHRMIQRIFLLRLLSKVGVRHWQRRSYDNDNNNNINYKVEYYY